MLKFLKKHLPQMSLTQKRSISHTTVQWFTSNKWLRYLHCNHFVLLTSLSFVFPFSLSFERNSLEKTHLFFLFIFKIIFYWLFYYSCPIFPLCPPLPSTPCSLRQPPHYCSCPCVMRISSLATPFPVLYFTSPWLFCNYLFVLFFKILFIYF